MPEFPQFEWLVNTPDVQVRVYTLGPGQGTPWHFHRVVTDNVFCLEPGLRVGLRGPDRELQLRPGERVEILPGRVHCVVNGTVAPLPYLLIQATGAYDFNEVE